MTMRGGGRQRLLLVERASGAACTVGCPVFWVVVLYGVGEGLGSRV